MTPGAKLSPHDRGQSAPGDRYVPLVFAGTVEPNYFCRGGNAKRVDLRVDLEADPAGAAGKYCRQRAGSGTAHPGVGRCKFHGGRLASTAPLPLTFLEHFPAPLRSVVSTMIGRMIADDVADPERVDVLRDRILSARIQSPGSDSPPRSRDSQLDAPALRLAGSGGGGQGLR